MIMENAGISIPSDEKKSRAKSGKGEKKVYRDSDDDGWDSRDEDFIATSDESEGEDISSSVQNKIRKYVEKSGEWLRLTLVFPLFTLRHCGKSYTFYFPP